MTNLFMAPPRAVVLLPGAPGRGSSLEVRRAPLGELLLPLAPVERLDLHRLHGSRVEATDVDAVAVRMRPRHIERFDAAGRAEEVPRYAGVERVRGQRFRALQQAKLRRGHDEMEIARF